MENTFVPLDPDYNGAVICKEFGECPTFYIVTRPFEPDIFSDLVEDDPRVVKALNRLEHVTLPFDREEELVPGYFLVAILHPALGRNERATGKLFGLLWFLFPIAKLYILQGKGGARRSSTNARASSTSRTPGGRQSST